MILKLKKAVSIAVVLAMVLLTAGCIPADAKPLDEEAMHLVQFEPPVEGQDIATIHTTYGDMKMMLFTDIAPNTVAHFKKLVESGFYEGNPVFEVDKALKIFLAGATDEDGLAGKVLTDDQKPVKLETSTDLWHFPGAVSAYGRVNGFNSKTCPADSRFFIVGNSDPQELALHDMEKYSYPKKVIERYRQVGGLPQYTGSFTVFGQIYDGMDIVDNIIQKSKQKEGTQKPAEDILIESIELSTYKAE